MDVGIRTIAGVFGTTIKHQESMENGEKLSRFSLLYSLIDSEKSSYLHREKKMQGEFYCKKDLTNHCSADLIPRDILC